MRWKCCVDAVLDCLIQVSGSVFGHYIHGHELLVVTGVYIRRGVKEDGIDASYGT